MTRAELLLLLQELDRDKYSDFEVSHSRADEALLEYINDAEITAAYGRIGKWYA